MMKGGLRKTVTAAAAVCMMIAGSAHAADGTKTVMEVNGTAVSAGTFAAYARYAQAQYYGYYEQMHAMFGGEMGDEFWNQKIQDDGESVGENESEAETASSAAEDAVKKELGKPSDRGEEYRVQLAASLADMVLSEQKMKEYGVEIPKDLKKKIDKTAEEYFGKNDPETFRKDGTSVDDVRRFLELEAAQVLVEDAVEKSLQVTVSDEEAGMSTVTYAKFSPSDFMPSEEATESVSEAEAATESAVDETEAETEAPDYEALAREAAEGVVADMLASEAPETADVYALAQERDPASLVSTDSFGTDGTGSSLPQEVVDKAKDLSDGEVLGEVVESDGVFYAVRMDDSFDEAATETRRSEIEDEKRGEFYEETVRKWEAEADLKVYGKALAKISINDSTVFSLKESLPEETESDEDDWRISAEKGEETESSAPAGTFESAETETE